MKCPNCGFEEETSGALECSRCSVVFSKWAAKLEKETAGRGKGTRRDRGKYTEAIKN